MQLVEGVLPLSVKTQTLWRHVPTSILSVTCNGRRAGSSEVGTVQWEGWPGRWVSWGRWAVGFKDFPYTERDKDDPTTAFLFSFMSSRVPSVPGRKPYFSVSWRVLPQPKVLSLIPICTFSNGMNWHPGDHRWRIRMGRDPGISRWYAKRCGCRYGLCQAATWHTWCTL